MKQFTLTLLVNEPKIIDRVEADDMIQLLAQFQLVVATTMKRVLEHRLNQVLDDDIPF